MGRCGDPERIYQAQRAGVVMPLVEGEHVNEFDAEHYTARWERVAAELGHERGSTGYRDRAWRWISAERPKR